MLKRRLLPRTGKRWLTHHIETFIKPNNGGKVPDLAEKFYQANITGPNGDLYLSYLRQVPILDAFLAHWAEAKKRAKGRVILLPGRDTWMFEVLARLEGVKTIFLPECSGDTKNWVAKEHPKKGEFPGCYAVDSGCAGSVPRALGCMDYGMVATTYTDHKLIPHDNVGPIYLVYEVLECLPKYWTRGTMDANNTKIMQKVDVDSRAFRIAAVGTILLSEHWLKVNAPRLKKERLERLAAKRATATQPTIVRRKRLSSKLFSKCAA